jgi:hypothetical protein
MNLRDFLEYVPLVAGVITAVLVLITTVLNRFEKRARVPPTHVSDDDDENKYIPSDSWITSRRVIPWLIGSATIFFVALLLLLILPKPPNRYVEILRPTDTVNVSQKYYNNDRGDYYYTFVVAGRCPDCDQDEWVQLFVQPPQGGPYIPQEGVPVIDDTWEAIVKIGNQENPIKNGENLLMQAAVIHENDVMDITARPTHPRRANERGLSKQYRLTVRIDQ